MDKPNFAVLLEDAIGNVRSWKYATLREAKQAAKYLPANGWSLVNVVRWNGNSWDLV